MAIMRELSPLALKQTAENAAKEARADLERQRRLEKTFREQILNARQTIKESRELLIQLDKAFRCFNRRG